MIATYRLASEDLEASLLLVLNGLVQHNVAWLLAARARKLEPPCCTGCAEPPWCATPVRYVPHHGAPQGEAREYWDGPTMFHRGEGTCADIVAYDCACLLLEGRDARIVLEAAGPVGEWHAVLIVDGERRDPASKIAKQHNVGRCGCEE